MPRIAGLSERGGGGRKLIRIHSLRTTTVCGIVVYLVFYITLFMRGHDDTNNWIGQLQGEQQTHPHKGYSVTSEQRSSLDILLDAVRDIHRPIPDAHIHNDTDDIDPIMAMDLCNNFLCGKVRCLSYNNTSTRRKRKRRIFAGGLIADESWHTIGASALEMFGIFHTIVFVESNRTQSYEPRQLRFIPGSEDHTLLTSGIYGPSTEVHVHHFVHEKKDPPMVREHMMRNVVLEQWKKLGMTRDDIGLIMDVDELATRRTLRALQICEVGNNDWDTSSNQNCRSPLVRLSVPFFEGSPLCIHKSRQKKLQFGRFLNPTMVIGACIEGIGDSDRHIVPPREGHRTTGRKDGYGYKYDYSALNKLQTDKHFPLYNAADFRKMAPSVAIYGGAGFHFHNFFDSIQQLRFKYATYGHVHANAFDVPLAALNSELNLLVRCVQNRTDDGNRKQRLQNGLKILKDAFALPVAFQISGYVEKRHEEVKAMVEEDEREYGRADKYDGHNMYRDHMLTHPGTKHRKNTNGLP